MNWGQFIMQIVTLLGLCAGLPFLWSLFSHLFQRRMQTISLLPQFAKIGVMSVELRNPGDAGNRENAVVVVVDLFLDSGRTPPPKRAIGHAVDAARFSLHTNGRT